MEENFLLELLRISSKSGKEKELGEFIVNRLKKNFRIEKQEINNNFNIFAYLGQPRIIFATHLDTIVGDLEIKKDYKYVYGRGVCDSKSQIAAMILAAEKALKRGLTDFGLLFTVQEETDFMGAKKAIELIPKSTKLIVVGEPTNLVMAIGQKGLVYLKISKEGKSAHGAMPEKGINAIELLMNDLIKLKDIKFKEDDVLGKNIINIGIIKGGSAPNIVPDYAEATVVIRNTVEPKEIIEQIKKEIGAKIEVLTSYEPVLNKEIKMIAKKLNLETKTVPYFTEAYFFDKKAKSIILGAGKEEDAHSKDEKVKIEDLKKLIQIYLKLIGESQ